MRGVLIIGLFLTAYAFGIIAENQVDPDLIQEKVQTNCPADPTFGGQCFVTNIQQGQPECRTINGVEFCREWWERTIEYKCDGDINVESLVQGFTERSFCWYERKCKKWQDVTKNGGTVTCRIYYDTLKPGCAENPYQAKCITDDCGDLFKYCTLTNYVSFGDISDKANLETAQYCDPVSGMCGERTVPGKSGVRLGTYTFNCPSDVRKVCTSWEVVKNCPDGAQSICQQTTTCVRSEQMSLETKETRSCIAKREYTDYKVIKGSEEEQSLANNPLCVKVGSDIETKDTFGIFSWGWDGDYGDKCGSCESYVTGLVIENPDGGQFKGSSACYLVSGAAGRFPNADQLRSFYNSYISGLFSAVSVLSVDLQNAQYLGNYENAYDRECFGDNGGWQDNRDYRVPLTLSIHYSTYRCFNNNLDTSACSNINTSSCTAVSDPSDLNNLACYKFQQDLDMQSKMVCSEYSILYECSTTKEVVNCLEWSQQISCQDGSVVIPDIQAYGKDFSADFLQAIGLAQAANELKHIWTGKVKQCDSGWWSSIVENPTDYFVSKAVSYAVSYFGSKIAAAAQRYFNAATVCLSPAIANYSACFEEVAQQDPENGFIQKICKGQLKQACDFLSDPVVQFAISLAIDIVQTTQKCNACTSESCAVKHGQYEAYALVNGGQCHYVGSKCSWKIDLGIDDICLRRGYRYCCYDSVFTRILVEQAYKQLGYGWGGFDSPNCSALTFDDLKKLDFSSMDFSELQAYIEAKMKAAIPEDVIKNKIESFYKGSDKVEPSLEFPYGNK